MRLLKFLFCAIIMIACAATCFAVCPDAGMITYAKAGGSGLLIAAPPVTLPTQQIVFLRSLKEEYEKIDTWLNEAEDLSSFVEQGQTLVFPEAGAEPEVYKNRVTDIDDVEPEETVHKEELDVYDSQNYKLRNIKMHALPFDKIAHYTKKSSDAIVKKEIADSAYAYAPETAGNKRVIIPTTGALRQGLKSMTLDDVVTLARACDNQGFPDGRNLVLPSDMWWDLVNNNAILKGQLERASLTGIIEPKVVDYYGFKIHKSLGNKLGIAYDLAQGKKAAQGAVITGDIVPTALLFCKNEVFKAGGKFEMFFQAKQGNTKGRATEFGFQHRFKSGFQMSAQRYSGLIYQDKA